MLSLVTAPLPARRSKAGPDLARMAELFHALSDETRLKIVQKLLGGERCVCDLTDALDAAQSRLSFHVKVLKSAGLVTDRREGRFLHYSLVPETLAELESFCCAARERAKEVSPCCG